MAHTTGTVYNLYYYNPVKCRLDMTVITTYVNRRAPAKGGLNEQSSWGKLKLQYTIVQLRSGMGDFGQITVL